MKHKFRSYLIIITIVEVPIIEEWCLLGCYAVWLLSTQKTPFFIVTAVKTSNLISIIDFLKTWITSPKNVYCFYVTDISFVKQNKTNIKKQHNLITPQFFFALITLTQDAHSVIQSTRYVPCPNAIHKEFYYSEEIKYILEYP
jgi:hypothetical protein